MDSWVFQILSAVPEIVFRGGGFQYDGVSWAISPEVVNGMPNLFQISKFSIFEKLGSCGQRCQEGAAGRRREPRETQGKWTAAISPVDSGEECYRMGGVRVKSY